MNISKSLVTISSLALLLTVALLISYAPTSAAKPPIRYVAPAGNDAGNNCTNKNLPCQHVQHAVDVAASGDAISLDKGTYIEQVTISKNLTLTGAGVDESVIKAPGFLGPDAQGKLNIVEINSAATVSANKLTVTGPGPGGCGSINSGIAIIGDATLNIDHAAVRDVRDNPLSGCQNGSGIRAGSQGGGPADVGHLFADHNVVTGYQKSGIVIAGTGSTGQISDNTVQSTPTDVIAANGIEILNGAVAGVEHNTVTGNECNLSGICGPDWVTQFQASGILLRGANAGTTVSHNNVFGNDMGIYANSGGEIDHNDVSANRYFGLVLDLGYAGNLHHNKADGADSSCPPSTVSCDGILVYTTGATYDHNSADKNGNDGIEVFSFGNIFDQNDMKGNISFDANDQSVGSGTAGTGNTWTENNCKSSSPTGLCK